MINLDKAYTSLSCNNTLKALGGKSGAIILNLSDTSSQITDKEVNFLSLSSSSHLAIAHNSQLEVYDTTTCKLLTSSSSHTKPIQSLNFSKSHLLASCSKDSQLLIWDLRSNSPCITLNTTKGVGIFSLAWSKQSNDIIVSGHDTALKLWDTRFSKKSLTTIRPAHPGRIIQIDWSSSTNTLVSTSLLNTVKYWKTSNASLSLINSTQTHFQSIKSIFSPDSSRIVYTTEQNEGKIQILSTEDLKIVASHSFSSSVEDIQWQDKTLVALCADRTLRTYSLEKGENIELNESICEEFLEDTLSCNLNNFGFEEEIRILVQNLKEGQAIEEFGPTQRYCIVRIYNKREFLRFMFEFPLDYPDSPPNYTLSGCSKYFSTSAAENVKSLEIELNKRSKQLCRCKGYSIQKIFDFLLDQLNSLTETDGYEDLNEFLEILEYQNYSKNTPISCIHAWHPNGDLLIFISSETSNPYCETEDLYDIESSHYQAGIHAEKFGANSDQEVSESQSSIMKIVHSKDTRIDLFKELSFGGSILEDLCKVIATKKNSKICEKFKLQDSAFIWSSFIPSLSLISTPNNWKEHPLGLKFLLKLLRYFWKNKNYNGLIFTSIFCALCLENLNISLDVTAFVEFNYISSKDLMFCLLKELSENLNRWGIMINSRAIMKIAGNLGTGFFLLSSEENLSFNVTHNYNVHAKNFCMNCDKKSIVCAICLIVVNSLGLFCKVCGHGGHLSHMQKWFTREPLCPTGCGCGCLSRLQSTDSLARGMTR